MQKKTDNSNIESKLALRRHFLKTYHTREERPVVLDACQGSGKIWDVLRNEFDVRYQGADVKPRRVAIKLDSSRLFDVPGWNFDIVDIDTYGEPWKHYEKLCCTATKAVTVFLTIGMVRVGGGGGSSQYVRRALGVPNETPPCLVSDVQNDMMGQLLWYPLGRLRLIECLEAPAGRKARYLGLRLLPVTEK